MAGFFDIYKNLCMEKGIAPTRAALEIGLSKATPTMWKKGITPQAAQLQKIADYFGVSVDYLLGKTDKKEGPASETENKPFQDEFIAFYGDVKDELTEDDIEDLKTFMRIRAEIKKQKEK